MKVGSKLVCLRGQHRPVLLAAGFFDGVHRGHQAIIRKIVRAARGSRAAAWVMTFDAHPLKVLRPRAAPPLLTSTPHKLQLLKTLGLHGCIVMPFTRALARQEPENFIAMLAMAAPTLRQIVIGRNWTFGHQGRGTPAMLKALAPAYGLKITVIPPVRWRGTVVSSTRIRAAVLAGRLTDAANMLGRPFSLLGTVVPGRGIGRQLGIPTANLNPHNEVAPPNGVYIIRARWDGRDYQGVANLGVRPTLKHVEREALSVERILTSVLCPPLNAQRSTGDGRATLKKLPASRVLELHLFGLDRNLYGKAIEVIFLKKLRHERGFPSLDALKHQILQDIQRAKSWLAHHA